MATSRSYLCARRPLVAVLLVAIVGGGPGAVAGASPPGHPPAGDVAVGRTIFRVNGCSDCHALAAANATATIGPNLDKLRLTYAELLRIISAGKTGRLGIMPSFEMILRPAQVADVAAFVYRAEHR